MLNKLMKHDISNDDGYFISYVGSTPTVPGYCSVWLCDDEMRKHICTTVPRQPT